MKSLFCTANMLVTLSLCAIAPIVWSCGSDPVHDMEVATLGDEVPGIAPGPFHRAGQPCNVCHGGEGPASTVFSMAGTIFNAKDTLVGADNVQVLLTDANKTSPPTNPVTNCVGNFFITPDQWTPAFPIIAGVQKGNIGPMTMLSQISRVQSCGFCHTLPGLEPTTQSVPPVYITVSNDPNELKGCPANPNAAGDGGSL